jgi:hypothetical protein
VDSSQLANSFTNIAMLLFNKMQWVAQNKTFSLINTPDHIQEEWLCAIAVPQTFKSHLPDSSSKTVMMSRLNQIQKGSTGAENGVALRANFTRQISGSINGGCPRMVGGNIYFFPQFLVIFPSSSGPFYHMSRFLLHDCGLGVTVPQISFTSQLVRTRDEVMI